MDVRRCLFIAATLLAPVIVTAQTTGVTGSSRPGRVVTSYSDVREQPALPEPPPGLTGLALERWQLEDFIAALQTVIDQSRTRRGFFFDPEKLLAWLARHGDVPPVELRSYITSYTGAELRRLKRASNEGNVAACVVLNHAYQGTLSNDFEPQSVGEVVGQAPKAFVINEKAGSYQHRARKRARTKIGQLRRRLERLNAGPSR